MRCLDSQVSNLNISKNFSLLQLHCLPWPWQRDSYGGDKEETHRCPISWRTQSGAWGRRPLPEEECGPWLRCEKPGPACGVQRWVHGVTATSERVSFKKICKQFTMNLDNIWLWIMINNISILTFILISELCSLLCCQRSLQLRRSYESIWKAWVILWKKHKCNFQTFLQMMNQFNNTDFNVIYFTLFLVISYSSKHWYFALNKYLSWNIIMKYTVNSVSDPFWNLSNTHHLFTFAIHI